MNLVSDIERALVKQRRKRVSKEIYQRFNGVIQDGIFEGLKLSRDTNTSAGVLGSKVLGFYENVVSEFVLKQGPYSNVINLGSADGYFAIGMLVKNLASRAICFEISDRGRASIRENAVENNCSSRIQIYGKADHEFYKKVSPEINDTENNLIICDIEGGEFDFISSDIFQKFKNCTWVIELHDKVKNRPKGIREKFLARIPKDLNYEIIKSKPIIWPEIELLEDLSDNDRALLFSEGRKKIGEWLTIMPNKKEF